MRWSSSKRKEYASGPYRAKDSQKDQKMTKIPRVTDEGWNSQKELSII